MRLVVSDDDEILQAFIFLRRNTHHLRRMLAANIVTIFRRLRRLNTKFDCVHFDTDFIPSRFCKVSPRLTSYADCADGTGAK